MRKKLLFYFINLLIVGTIGFALVYYPVDVSTGAEPIGAIWYVLWAVITLILSGILSYLESKYDYYEKLINKILNSKKALATVLIEIAFGGITAAVVELIVSRFIVGLSSMGTYFNKYRFFFFWAIAFTAVYLIRRLKKNNMKAENMFAAIALSTGLVMIFSSPFGHTCWDVDSHYRYALGEASLFANITDAHMQIFRVEENGVYWAKTTAAENEAEKAILNEMDKHEAGVTGHYFSLPHLPAAIVFALGRLFKMSFFAKELIAKAANLLLYTLICYSAIKRLKTGKMIASVIALFPTNVFMAANIDYDWWVISFVILGIAYFLSEAQQPSKKITLGETVMMYGSLTFACLPKQIYFPVLLLPFLLKKNYFKTQKNERKKYMAIGVIAISLLMLSFLVRTYFEIKKGGDLRGGEGINAMEQIRYIFKSPFEYTGTLLRFLMNYLKVDNSVNYICNFAYIGFGSGYSIFVIMLIAAAFTDKNEYDLVGPAVPVRIAFGAVFFVTLVLVATAFYIAYTPVGLTTGVGGCQPRYLTPILFVLLPIIGSAKLQNRMNRNYYNALFGIGCSAVLYHDIYEVMITKML